MAARADEDVERIAELLSRIARAIRSSRTFDLETVDFDLTLAQGRCLKAIAQHENCTLRELSAQLAVSAPTASELVDRLVNLDLVRREEDPNDRRFVRINLAPKGQELLIKHREQRREHMKGFLSRLTDEQRQAMLNALEVLEQAVQN